MKVKKAKPTDQPLPPELLRKMDAYWRAANYLSVGQIYLYDNPLLKKPLKLEHVKPRLLGHWGTTPGLNFIYVHLNRIIKAYDLNMIFVTGPGHGGPGLVANTYLEGTYSELYPNVSQDEGGMKRLFTQFSFPGGIPSHAAPETPGSIHEGGELGYSLAHAYGAVFDNPDLLAACVVGDSEAETGALPTSWHSNKFLNPAHDGAVLPILHLNGYKIANPTVLARISREELTDLFRGYGYQPYFVEGDDPETMHQVPLSELAADPKHLKMLEKWMKSYKPEELFDKNGRLRAEFAELAPKGSRRLGANPQPNGGILLRDLKMPDFRDYAVVVPKPGAVVAEATWIQPSGSGVHRPRGEQKGRHHPRLSAPRHQYPAVRNRPLSAQPQLCQCHRRRQAARAAVAGHGCRHQTLHGRARHLGMGQQRPRKRS
jgi:xylulose-5-phosphate/fructose-6-phosphate phosphoketolase